MVAMNKTLIDFAHSQIKGQAMSREQAIEQAANDVLAKWDSTGFIDTRTKDYSLMIALKKALAPPKDETADAVVWQRRISSDGIKWGKWYQYCDNEHDQTRPPRVDRWFAEYRPLYTHPPKADSERVAIAWHVATKYGNGVSYSDKFWELHPNFYQGAPEPSPERVALVERIDEFFSGGDLNKASVILGDIRAYLGGE
jgi:hypothetical protein